MTPSPRDDYAESVAVRGDLKPSRREAIRTIGAVGVSAAAASIAVACTDKRGGASERSVSADWYWADAFIDFTTKPDGPPPAVLDSGQAVDFTLQKRSGEEPRISKGRLVHGKLPHSGEFANYYQAQLDGACDAYGTSYTVDSQDGSSTEGAMCIAVWGSIFEADGAPIPRTPGHITINTINREWKWWVGDGTNTGTETHLKVIKEGIFSPPPSDGLTQWKTEVYLDPRSGTGFLYLPGEDALTKSRYITITDSEIASVLSAQSLQPLTIEALLRGANVVMVEHYAFTEPSTARYPQYVNMWGLQWAQARDPLAIRALLQNCPNSVIGR